VHVLGFDTATPTVTVALGSDGEVLGGVRLAGGRRHAEQLAPAIRYLCDETGVALSRLAAVAVGIGPGLFTGLRVGVTTARTLAQALQIPVVAIPTLDLLAYPLRHARRPVVAIVDARRREVFWARYRPVPGGVQRITEYEVASPADVVAELEAAADEVLLAGDGVVAYRHEFAALDRAEPAGPAFAAPSATSLVELATARVEREEFVAPLEVHPMYLRASDAEINRSGAA
jgi:tRNA threonylcarbamoyladenosine biosynthesis protein TsaB